MQNNGADQVSTTFHPRALLGQRTGPDIAFVSSDGVRFHAHNIVLDAMSVNGFGGLLASTADNSITPTTPSRYIHVPDDAATFNVVLLAAYELSPQPYSPDLSTLLRAADTGLRHYGLLSSHTVTPGAPLANVLLAHAQRGANIALDIYTFAARHQVGPLAVSVSIYMHGLDLSTISDERAQHLGGTYLRRLFMLILDRMEALKRMLLVAPGPLHLPTVLCGPSERSRDVSGPWALAVSQLMVDARADVPGARLEATLNSLLLQCACPECRTAIQHRIRAIVLEWQAVRRTI